ncbi:hypothetical protein [Noviherbaspirillum denitrificans]|uniref:Uncharacterized protein n=1 Tax=Noviherbaspirillum denitrificans TaxID=1968433 RepID=A0A254TM08_9BURK|nr:hypothetical protein [Noviherbaspirillum denitrificans]OWW21653.1 hypothetical protein AYR66_21360 [Noviherbaspirillum denitrificans]
MFNNAEQELSLPDRQVRYSLAVRIAMVLLAFFSAAWCLLQWTLTTEPRFMMEGISRQFVTLEASACAGLAAVAFVFMIANGLGWLATVIRIRRAQSGKLAVKQSARRIGAYV